VQAEQPCVHRGEGAEHGHHDRGQEQRPEDRRQRPHQARGHDLGPEPQRQQRIDLSSRPLTSMAIDQEIPVEQPSTWPGVPRLASDVELDSSGASWTICPSLRRAM
jgi:hypothetical protein